jgi:hypothetical protein
MIRSAIPLIECFKATTWEITTLITEPYKSFPNQVTMHFHENAILATWQAAGAVCPPESFLVQVNLHREVTDTYSAVHPARGNKFFSHVLQFTMKCMLRNKEDS